MGVPGASNWKEELDASAFEGIETIYVVVEPDSGGKTLRAAISKSSIAPRVRFITLDGHKDVSALHLACKTEEEFREKWQAALQTATPYQETASQEAAQAASEAWSKCQELALKPDILSEFLITLKSCGLAGEETGASLIYLAVTSRLLARPVSLAVKGPSSAGKSYLTDCVLKFFPSSAYYCLSAMSDKCLAYSEEPVAHRFLVFYEAAGLSKGFATYFVRSLLSEGRIRYETVEKTKDGLRPRLIEREGPTGLLLTTTEVSLHGENETRMFSVPATDTSEQTRAVLEVLASEELSVVDLGEWQALQEWLRYATHEVTIPYGPVLARLIPPVATRLRRDFGALLHLIRAHAILHQKNREQTANGKIIATLGDYAAVRNLVAGILAEGLEATVPPTIRKTVEAVSQLTGAVTYKRVGDFLRLDKSTAQRRCRDAIARGYLVNIETREFQPAQLVLGDAMPEDLALLPDQEALTVAWEAGGCSASCNRQSVEKERAKPDGCTVARKPEIQRSHADDVYLPPGCDIDEVLEREAIRAEGCGVDL